MNEDLVAALLAEADRWERLAAEEGAAADRHRTNGSNPDLAARLSGWRSARMVAVSAVRRIVAEHTIGQQRT